MLKYAMTQYHQTLSSLMHQCLDDPTFEERISTTLKSGRIKADKRKIAREARRLMRLDDWACAPLKDYVLGDLSASLSSYYELKRDETRKTNKPELPTLDPPTEHDIQQATVEFAGTVEYELPEDVLKEIAELEKAGQPKKARRLRNVGHSRMVSKAAGQLLRKTQAALPRPIEFTRCEKRGFVLFEREGRFFIGLRLFGTCSRYYKPVKFSGMINWKTKTEFTRKTAMVLFPVSMSRGFHEAEYLKHGTPQSAKLVWKKGDDGEDIFTVNIAFRFDVDPVETETVLGIDRGWKKIAACSLLAADSSVQQSGIGLEGTQFYQALRRYERRIARLQQQGKRGGRKFRVRGRMADNALGEFANKLVNVAAENKSQVVLEKLNATAMNRFLTRSQLAKLEQALTYKLQRKGLPEPLLVSAAYTSQTCAVCGRTDKANRPKMDSAGKPIQDVFLCVECGHSANADENASVVIALRGHHLQQWKKEGKKGYPNFESFSEWLKTGRAGVMKVAPGSCSGQALDGWRMTGTCAGVSDPHSDQCPFDANLTAGAEGSAEPETVDQKTGNEPTRLDSG